MKLPFLYSAILAFQLLFIIVFSSVTVGKGHKFVIRKSVANIEVDSSEMVLVNGGTFNMGTSKFSDSKPIHKVEVSSFYIDRHEVTNEQFGAFVEATGYITIAEKPLNPADFPDADPELLKAGGTVFTAPAQVRDLHNAMQWWSYVPGANWRHPEGPESNIKGKERHPVVQIAYEDAVAYATWAGKRLPTEAEWEYAARAGDSNDNIYYWGNELTPNNRYMANIFQGKFPVRNTLQDGYATTAPVGQYSSNAFGIFDLEGNVWEWCSDFYQSKYLVGDAVEKNPQGPIESYDPKEPHAVKRVLRGGSFLCSDQYCERYKAGARGKGEVSSPTNNIGFRCVKDLK